MEFKGNMTNGTDIKYIIFDTDMGSDDAFALQMLLKAEKSLKNIKILAITTVHGNTTIENVLKNTYRLLDGSGRTDIPIYRGVNESLIPVEIQIRGFHGENGFGNVEFWDPAIYPSDVNTLVQKKHAVEIIRDLVMERPHQILLICAAPLTNIALALRTYPEIRENIRDVFIMGGTFKGAGNITACAEFNFFADPEAAHIVLDSLKCPITIVPWECCFEVAMNISKEWRFDVLGNANWKNLELLNKIDAFIYRNYENYAPSDALLTAALLFPEKCIKTIRQCHATVELHGRHCRGQMVLDHLGKNKHNNNNVTIVETMDAEEMKNALLWAVTL